jgi:enoyl-CoA hydratase/carnithine racemase
MHEWNLEPTDGAWLLTMANSENRINRSTLDAWANVLDRVEADASQRSLVVASLGEKDPETLRTVKQRLYDDATSKLMGAS